LREIGHSGHDRESLLTKVHKQPFYPYSSDFDRQKCEKGRFALISRILVDLQYETNLHEKRSPMRAFRRPWADKEISRIPQAASDNRSAGALETKGRRVLAPAWFFRAVTSSKQAWLPPLNKKTTRHSSGGLSFRGDSRKCSKVSIRSCPFCIKRLHNYL
jgi:hypothetical protein